MKLRRIKNDEIVTVRYTDGHYAVAEAHELKAAGFSDREVTRDCPEEWTLQARSYQDFLRLASSVPLDAIILPWNG